MSTTVSTLLAYVEQKTQAGTGTLNGANGISFLNEALLDFRGELIKRGIDAAQTQESYVATVSTVTLPTGSTFAWPTDMFFLKTISVNFTDTTANNYIQAQQVDVSNVPGNGTFEWLRANQPTAQPLFDDRGDTFEIFPAFQTGMNLTNAIRIFYFLTPTPYASTSDTLSYPDSLDWYILAIKVASLYYESLNKFEEAAYWRKLYEARVAKVETTLAQGSQQPLEAQGLALTGFEY